MVNNANEIKFPAAPESINALAETDEEGEVTTTSVSER